MSLSNSQIARARVVLALVITAALLFMGSALLYIAEVGATTGTIGESGGISGSAEVADPVATFELWWLILGPIVSLVFPFIVRAGGGTAGKWFRFVLSIVLAAAVSVVTVYQSIEPDAVLTVEFVLSSAMAVIASMKASYEIIDGAVQARTGAGLNEQSIYPAGGIGPGDELK